MYVDMKNGRTYRVIPFQPTNAGATNKRSQNAEHRIQTRLQKSIEDRQRAEDGNVQLYSTNLYPQEYSQLEWKAGLKNVENQIQCLAVTAEKALGAKKIDRDTRNPSSNRDNTRSPSTDRRSSENYRRGQVVDNRYSSKERKDIETRSQKVSSSYEQRSRSRDNSRDYRDSRNTSRSPSRDRQRQQSSNNRSSRRDGGTYERRTGDRYSRERSVTARQTYPKMAKGENCSFSYDPLKAKTCSKCPISGHHEFDCFKYPRYSPKKCSVCDKYYHFSSDCKELEKFPPKLHELNNHETENY